MYMVVSKNCKVYYNVGGAGAAWGGVYVHGWVEGEGRVREQGLRWVTKGNVDKCLGGQQMGQVTERQKGKLGKRIG